MSKLMSRISWFGILLVAVGIIMLLDHFKVFSIDFSNIFWPLMMLVGIAIVSKGFSGNQRGKIFWGSLLFLYSLFFFLRSIDYFDIHGRLIFPASFIIFGVAFFMMYLGNTKDWPLIIPAAILGGMGIIFILTEYGYLYRWDVWDAIVDYWPVLLILVGIIMILKHKSSSTQLKPPQTPVV
jgi:LiaF transmembrane domain/LiaI-LiaF-like transmembrane region